MKITFSPNIGNWKYLEILSNYQVRGQKAKR